MAGPRETPRQKMIGMMYLVLTAMLALQVSAAIIEKFILLNNSLEQASDAGNKINQETVLKIQSAVEKSGNRAADVLILRQAESVRKRSALIVDQLRGFKQEIIAKAGDGLNEEGAIKNPQEEEKVAQLMIGGGSSKRGKAYSLKDTLNNYVTFMNQFSAKGYAPIAQDGREDPITRNNKDQRGKDFANLNFGQTPVAAALAVLSQKETDVRRIEGESLNFLAAKVGAADVKFDRILAMMSPESRVVAAGTKFKARMFIAASATGITPKMALNGSPVKVQDGVGVIDFTAQGGGYNNEGIARKVLKGDITFRNTAGVDTTLTVQEEYFVAKPTYSIESASMPPLFLGCANELKFNSPQLGALWAPSFKAAGGTAIPGGAKGSVTLVPSSAKLDLTIVNQGSSLGVESFRVNRVPKPSLVLKVGAKAANEQMGERVSAVRNITVEAEADESFKRFNPKDAQFRVTEFIVNLARGTQRVATLTFNANTGNVSTMAAKARPGDRYVVEIKKVARRNFEGNVSDVEMGNQVRTIPLY